MIKKLNRRFYELHELYEVTAEQIKEIENIQGVLLVENNGASEFKLGYIWFNVCTIDGEFDFYMKDNN